MNTCEWCKAAFPRGRYKCCSGGARSCGGCIRGLLCVPCNQTLGWLETGIVDPVDRCFGVAAYLLRGMNILTEETA